MKSLKKLVRSIGPFNTKRRQENSRQFKQGGEDFDLRGIDVHNVLFLFFNQYNPDEIPKIDERLKLYAGDESQLLTELYQKYEVSKVEMQWFINQSRCSMDDTNNEIPIADSYHNIDSEYNDEAELAGKWILS